MIFRLLTPWVSSLKEKRMIVRRIAAKLYLVKSLFAVQVQLLNMRSSYEGNCNL